MNVIDIILIVVIAAIVAGAFYLAVRRDKRGGCCGDCCKCGEKRTSDCKKNKQTHKQ